MEMKVKQNVSPLRRRITLDAVDKALIAVVQGGLPLCERPFAAIAQQVGLDEQIVIHRLQHLQDQGAIKRFGVVVRHHELGYQANAMVVFDIADEQVAQLGRCIGKFEYVTLCYRRPRVLPDWPYNLFCMIHGKDRDAVLLHIQELMQRCGLQEVPHAVLFSKRRFKQRGAVYRASQQRPASVEA
jgi:DNA-binding Lrp family transcriptional regulator